MHINNKIHLYMNKQELRTKNGCNKVQPVKKLVFNFQKHSQHFLACEIKIYIIIWQPQ